MHTLWNFGRDENESVGVGSGGWSEGGNRKTTVILPCQALKKENIFLRFSSLF